jgi:hypothetical protein
VGIFEYLQEMPTDAFAFPIFVGGEDQFAGSFEGFF